MDQDQKIKEFFTRDELVKEENNNNKAGLDQVEIDKEEEKDENFSNKENDQQEVEENNNQENNDQDNLIQQNDNQDFQQEDQEIVQEEQEIQQEDQEFQQNIQEQKEDEEQVKEQDNLQIKGQNNPEIINEPQSKPQIKKKKIEKKNPPKIAVQKPNLEEINKNLKEIKQKLNINLSKLLNPETRVQAMTQLKETIKENTNEHALKVYIHTICEKQKSTESGAQESEIILIGFICQMYKTNLVDQQDKPPCLETTVLKLVESIHRYFTEASIQVQQACPRALIDVYVNCLSKLQVESVIMILFDPIFELIASGNGRVSQQTATICLSELISYMKKINQKVILQKIKKKIINSFLKANPEFYMIMDSLETCLSIFGFDFIKSKLKQVLNKLILFIRKVQTGQQNYQFIVFQFFKQQILKCKVQVCRILQVIATYQIDDILLQDLEYQNIVEILKDLAKNEKNAQVQVSSFEALRQWEKLILKDQAQLKEPNIVNNPILKTPCLNNFKSLREKFKQQKETENQIKNKQNQVLKRTQETPEKVIDKKNTDDLGSKVYIKKGSGFGGGYFGTGIPKRQIEQMNLQSHEKKLKDLREMINKGIDRSLSNEKQSDAQILLERQKKIDSNFIINRPKTANQNKLTKEDNLIILNQKIKNNQIIPPQINEKEQQYISKEQKMKEYKALQQELIQNYITQEEIFEDSLQIQTQAKNQLQNNQQEVINEDFKESLQSQQFDENLRQSIKQSVLTIISEHQNESKMQNIDEQNLKKMIKEQFDQLINQQPTQQINPLQELIRKQIAEQINQFLKENQINLMIQKEKEDKLLEEKQKIQKQKLLEQQKQQENIKIQQLQKKQEEELLKQQQKKQTIEKSKSNQLIENQPLLIDQFNYKRQIFPPQQLNLLYPGQKTTSPIISRQSHGIIPPQQLNLLTQELKPVPIQELPQPIQKQVPQKEPIEIKQKPPTQTKPIDQQKQVIIEKPSKEGEDLRETLLIEKKKQEVNDDIWAKVEEKIKSQDLNEAYNIILQQEDDIYLLKLAQLTGPCTSQLSLDTSQAIVIRLSQILSSDFTSTLAINLFDECLEHKILQDLSNTDSQNMLEILYGLAESPNQFIGETSAQLFYKIESELNKK